MDHNGFQRNKSFIFVSLFTFLIFTGFAQAAGYDNNTNQFWVRPDGDNTCSGQQNLSYAENSTDCAWRTIQKSADTLSSGQKVRVQSGTYHENVSIYNDDAVDHDNTTFIGDGYPVVACLYNYSDNIYNSWGFGIGKKLGSGHGGIFNVTVTGFEVRNCSRGFFSVATTQIYLITGFRINP